MRLHKNFKNPSNLVHRITEEVINTKFNPLCFTDKGIEANGEIDFPKVT